MSKIERTITPCFLFFHLNKGVFMPKWFSWASAWNAVNFFQQIFSKGITMNINSKKNQPSTSGNESPLQNVQQIGDHNVSIISNNDKKPSSKLETEKDGELEIQGEWNNKTPGTEMKLGKHGRLKMKGPAKIQQDN